MEDTSAKLAKLKEILTGMGRVLVCYSGGTDSTFLLHIAKETLGIDVAALFFTSPLIPENEQNEIKKLASVLRVKLFVVDYDILSEPGMKFNPEDACIVCKKFMLSKAKAQGSELGFDTVADGTVSAGEHYDMVKEMGIVSPLMLAGFSKEEIAALSESMGIARWARPYYSCLLIRFPHGEEITMEKLKKVEVTEEFMWQLGFYSCKVRATGDDLTLCVDIQDADTLLHEYRQAVENVTKQLSYQHLTVEVSDPSSAGNIKVHNLY
jgi:uncharacterized protein